MGFKKSLMKNVAVFGSYNYFFFFIEFVSTMILSRLLGPEEFGFVVIIFVVSGFIQWMFLNAGLSQAVIRTDYGSTFFKLLFNLAVWIGMFMSLILILLAYPIALFKNNLSLIFPTIVTSASLVLSTIVIVPRAILLKELKFNILGKYTTLSALVGISLMILMAYTGFSYWSLIVPNIIREFLFYYLIKRKVNFGFYFYNWSYTKFAYKKVKNLVNTYLIFNVINYWSTNLDKFLISKFYGDAIVGIYNRSYRFLQMGIKLINTVFGSVLLPSLKKEIEANNEYKKGLLDILDIVHLLGFLFSIALVIIPKFVVRVLWGEDWLGVADYMPYFGAIIPLQTLIIACDDLYVLEMKEKSLLRVGVPASIILILGIVIGSFISALDVARLYAAFFVVLQVPYHLIFGHYKVLNFPVRLILTFWLPKIAFSMAILYSLLYLEPIVSQVIFGAYSVYLGLTHIKNFRLASTIIKEKLRKK